MITLVLLRKYYRFENVITRRIYSKSNLNYKGNSLKIMLHADVLFLLQDFKRGITQFDFLGGA